MREALKHNFGEQRYREIAPQLPRDGEVIVTVRDADGALRTRTAAHEGEHVADVRRDFSNRIVQWNEGIRELARDLARTGTWLSRAELSRAIIERTGLDLPDLTGDDPVDRLAQALHHDFAGAGTARDMNMLTDQTLNDTGVRVSMVYDAAHRHLTVTLRDTPATSARP